MKKSRYLFLALPLFCACSGAEISDDETIRLVEEFETKLEQKTSFSYFEEKTVIEGKTFKTTEFYQVFFEENFIHSYSVHENRETKWKSTAYEEWSFVKDKTIYKVTTKDAENTETGRIVESTPFELEIWQGKMNYCFKKVKGTNSTFFNRIKDEVSSKNDQTKIVSRSKNEGSLIYTIERYDSSRKMIRYKNYEFVDSLVQRLVDKDDFSTTTTTYKYKVTTQEPNIPNF